MSEGIGRIAAERVRQISDEGWSADHDDEHGYGELAVRAAELAAHGTSARLTGNLEADEWELVEKHRGDRLRQLAIAGALIAAEIDRLVRHKEYKKESAAFARKLVNAERKRGKP